jgi:hypothetical protein
MIIRPSPELNSKATPQAEVKGRVRIGVRRSGTRVRESRTRHKAYRDAYFATD